MQHNLKKYLVLLVLFLAIAGTSSAQKKGKTSPKATIPTSAKLPEITPITKPTASNDVTITTKNASLKMELFGGAFTSFTAFGGQNPLTFALTPDQMPRPNRNGALFQGHFLCLGRWGAASEAEQLANIPHNGEVNTQMWKVIMPLKKENDTWKYMVQCLEPKERMTVVRTVLMPDAGKSFFVEERFYNTSPLGRVTNMVQHATIGPPFLNASTVIDCNATLGFDQDADPEKIEAKSFTFPNAKLESGQTNLRSVNDDRGWCTSHIFDSTTKYGWVTASNIDQQQLIGYIWRTADYPWLNLWHWKKDGAPYAHGLEFGTTGVGKPYQFLLDKRISFFGHNSFQWLEANQNVAKGYIGFITNLPKDWQGTGAITLNSGILLIQERNPNLTLSQDKGAPASANAPKNGKNKESKTKTREIKLDVGNYLF